MKGKSGKSGALEPYYEYVVEISIGECKIHPSNIIPVLTLARSEYEARDKVHTKMMSVYPDISRYSFGKKSFSYKKNPLACN